MRVSTPPPPAPLKQVIGNLPMPPPPPPYAYDGKPSDAEAPSITASWAKVESAETEIRGRPERDERESGDEFPEEPMADVAKEEEGVCFFVHVYVKT